MRRSRATEPSVLILAEPPAQYATRPPLVVDCSLVCAVVFLEPEREQARARMSGCDLHAPALLDYEVASVALKKLRDGRQSGIEDGLTQFAAARITLHAVDIGETVALAQHCALSAYDAAYLWLAAELRSPLATFDRRLGEAAQKYLGTLEGGPWA